jgi:hypothetical protein
VISWVFFVPLNIFWAFPEIVFALKNISEKTQILSLRFGARRPDPHPLWLSRQARQGPSAR